MSLECYAVPWTAPRCHATARTCTKAWPRKSLKLRGSRSGCVTKFLEETGPHSAKSTLSYKPNHLDNPRISSRLRRWRAIPTQGFGHWLLARQLAHGWGALVLHDAEEEHVSVWLQRLVQSVRYTYTRWLVDATHTATRDNGRQWNPGERVTDIENWQGLTWGFVGAMIMVKEAWAEFAVTSGSRLGPTTRTLVFSEMQVVGQTAHGARQKASPWSPHLGTPRLSRDVRRRLQSMRKAHVHIKTRDDLQVFLENVHTSRRRERGGQITTTDIPALGIAQNLREESSPTFWNSLKLEEFAASFPPDGRRWSGRRGARGRFDGRNRQCWVAIGEDVSTISKNDTLIRHRLKLFLTRF